MRSMLQKLYVESSIKAGISSVFETEYNAKNSAAASYNKLT